MIKKLVSTISKYSAAVVVASIVLIWALISHLGIVPVYMLPSPIDVVRAFISDFSLFMENAAFSLSEAFAGLFLSIACAFILSVVMDMSTLVHRSIYPLLILTQTVPVVAIAPLLVLWLGYGMLPKIVLIFLVCFFPVTIGLLGGFKNVDKDQMLLFKSMGASKMQILFGLKIPSAMPEFFAGLKIAATYSLVGAVVAEWLGGSSGLGVYMTRVRKSYSFDKMFAVIIFISLLSLMLLKLIGLLEKKVLKYRITDK